MRVIKTQIQAVVDGLSKITDDASLPLQTRFNNLQRELLNVRKQLQELQYPQRSDEELELDMLRVRQFTNAMTVEQGAVTCANVYNRRFFEQDGDRRFTKLLAQHLVGKYERAALLIEPTYMYWRNLAGFIAS